MENITSEFYDAWKRKYIKFDSCTNSLYVYHEDDHAENICVSEGQGYGMIIVAYMAGYDKSAKKTYDSLFRYYIKHIVNNPSDTSQEYTYLMSGFLTNTCNFRGDAATDGDLDIAYSLLLADAQWSSSGNINYFQCAANLNKAILAKEINDQTYTILKGNAIEKPDIHDKKDKGSKDYFDMRTSDFMPAHFKVFSRKLNTPKWDTVINNCYQLFNTMQDKNKKKTGLLPDFIVNVRNPVPATPPYEEQYPGDFYHNACRAPWRIATDYILNKDSNSKRIVERMNKWIMDLTHKDCNQIAEGYHLNGKPIKGTEDYPVMSFVCPFAVSAMVDSANQEWLNILYHYITAFKTVPEKFVEEDKQRFDYYNNTIKMLTLIILSGNYWQP
jgi:endoglucanase